MGPKVLFFDDEFKRKLEIKNGSQLVQLFMEFVKREAEKRGIAGRDTGSRKGLFKGERNNDKIMVCLYADEMIQ